MGTRGRDKNISSHSAGVREEEENRGQLFAGIYRKRLKGLGSFLLAVHWLYHLIDLFIGKWASRRPCPLDVIDTAEDATVNLTGNPKYFPNSLAIHVLIYKKEGLDMQISKI